MSNSSVSMMDNLKNALRRNIEFAGQGAERLTGVQSSTDEFVSIFWLFEGENAAVANQSL